MESQRDILRVIEKEIKKGSAPVAFAGLGVSEECYHLVDSQAKMNQLLDYFFRNEEYAALSETCNRIYKLQDVDVLFQCLLMDQMDWEEEKLYVQFSTIYLLKQTVKN